MTPEELSAYLREQGRKGGKIGGRITNARMTPDQRIARAKKGAAARWSKQDAPRVTRDWPIGTRFLVWIPAAAAWSRTFEVTGHRPESLEFRLVGVDVLGQDKPRTTPYASFLRGLAADHIRKVESRP
jgi:hypothetical protein